MRRKEDLTFIKTIYNIQPSPALLNELRTALSSSKKKRKTFVSSGSRGTLSVVGLILPSVLKA
jgi:hypothetical protein